MSSLFFSVVDAFASTSYSLSLCMIFQAKVTRLVDIVIVYMTSFFFFQAEDGIRDDLVTGVQTCALPIFRPYLLDSTNRLRASYHQIGADSQRMASHNPNFQQIPDKGIAAELRRYVVAARSEERRVGKECRSRWSPYH